eukprot:403339240
MEATVETSRYFIPDPEHQTLSTIQKDDDDIFELELKDKIQLTHDTYRIVFKLPEENHVLGLNLCGHISFHNTDADGKQYTRKYTPVSQVNERGTVSFVIKIYRKCDEFINGGKMSQSLESYSIGDKVKMEGPFGQLSYLGHSNFLIRKKPVKKTRLGLIAAGTGITPIYSIVQASTLAQDGLEMSMIYSNKTLDDILLKEDLDNLVTQNKDKLSLYHTLTRHNEEKDGKWDGLTGRVNAEMLKQCKFPEPSEETLIAYCGPLAFGKMMEETLLALGYTNDMFYKF